MVEDRRKGRCIPSAPSLEPDSVEFECCPGRGYSIVALGGTLFPEATCSDIDLGRYIELFAGYSSQEHIARGATSGGIMTAIAEHLLETGRVTGVVATRTCYTTRGPRSNTFLADSIDGLIQAQGSKYCPTPALAILKQLERAKGPVAFIGTPCQIAGLRMLQGKYRSLMDKIYMMIGSFCGGYRDLRETDTLIRRVGIRPSDVIAFRYRGGGQPGAMMIESREGQRVVLPYPDYMRRTGFIKTKRCRLCVDATAELADISCGDAWLDRFLWESSRQWSIAIVRSTRAREVVSELSASGRLHRTVITAEEVKQSQSYNIASKKVRYEAKTRFYRGIGSATPEFDGGFRRSQGGVLKELNVFVRQHVIHCLEVMGLYPVVARVFKRY